MSRNQPDATGPSGRRPNLRHVLQASLRRPPQAPQAAVSYVVPMKPQLQAFQIAMLQTEYGDFATKPRFKALVDFFFGALYAPADFGLRNESFRTLHEWLAGIVGHDPVRVLAQAIELYELTESLDDDMLLALRADGIDGNASFITQAAWESAYRRVGRRLDRQRQADLIVDNGKVLETACRVPFVHAQLRAFRPAAGLLGWGHVVDFLLQGQEALARARPIDPLLDAISLRERARIDRLLGHP